MNIDDTFMVYKKSNNYVYLINNRFQRIICYDLKDLNLYSTVHIKGQLDTINEASIPMIFSFKNFLKTHNINYSLTLYNYEIISNGDTFKSTFLSQILANFSLVSKNSINLFLFSIKDNFDAYDDLVNLNIVQLVVVSGFHFNILAKYLGKIKFKYINIFIIVFFLFYLYLLNFSIPASRAFFMYILSLVSKRKYNVTSFSNFLLVSLLFLVFDPYMLLRSSFQLSFLATLLIIIFSKLNIKKLKLNFYMLLGLLPLLIIMQNQINLLAIFFQLILTPIISFLYLFSWITLIFDFLDPIYGLLVNNFFNICTYLSSTSLSLVFRNLSPCFLIIYYIIYYFIVYFKCLRINKLSNVFLTFLLTITCLRYFSNYFYEQESVTFFDVGQGDCALISLKNNQGHILVDTGGSFTIDYACQRIIPYLKANGINKLDKVIITHDDFDHCGALDSLKDNFKVNEIIYAYNERKIVHSYLELINLNLYYDEFSDDNDKSGVFLFELFNKQFLLMGDASKEIEKKIINDYELDIDYLKVGHHGSDTSSCFEFLDSIDGEYAIISVGKYNNYGHPHQSVIESLNELNYKILRTDQNGLIKVKESGVYVTLA